MINQFYAISKQDNNVKYVAPSLFSLKKIISENNMFENEFYILKDVDMKYISRIVYVDGECVYNNKNFWLNTASSILEDYSQHTVLDFMSKPIDQFRFEIELESNASRLAVIDGVAGEIDYNITIGNEFISIFREECVFTDFKSITPLEIGRKLSNVIILVQTGSFREAKLLLQQVETDAFLTEERLTKYKNMLDAADVITYATDEDYYYTADTSNGVDK